MIVAQNKQDLEHAKHLTTQAKSDAANFLHDEIGYNYRMTNIQAALGIAQLEQLEDYINIKTNNYNKYFDICKNFTNFKILEFEKGIKTNYWFYSLIIDDKVTTKDKVINRLKDNSIQARPIWGLIHQQIPYKGSRIYDIQKANYYYNKVVNLPCSTNLSFDDVIIVMKVIKELD